MIIRNSRPEEFQKKKVYLKILQNSQQGTCVGVSFLIMQAPSLQRQ